MPQELTSTSRGPRRRRRRRPDVDIEDDSSFAWVVFRQDFDDHPRVLARRLLGSTFEPAGRRRRRAVGRLGAANRPQRARRGHRRRSPRRTTASSPTCCISTPSAPPAAPGHAGDDARPRRRRRRSARTARPPSSWLQAPTAADARGVHARRWIIDQTERGYPGARARHASSRNPAFGPSTRRPAWTPRATASATSSSCSSRAPAPDRRLVVAEYDRVPGRFFGYAGTKLRAALKAAAGVGGRVGDLGPGDLHGRSSTASRSARRRRRRSRRSVRVRDGLHRLAGRRRPTARAESAQVKAPLQVARVDADRRVRRPGTRKRGQGRDRRRRGRRRGPGAASAGAHQVVTDRLRRRHASRRRARRQPPLPAGAAPTSSRERDRRAGNAGVLTRGRSASRSK